MRFSLFLFLLLLSSCGLYNGVTASEGEGEGEGEGETQPCNDADLDGYGEGCVLGDDCDESSRERFRQFDVFADSDGDGFTLGEPNSRCIGELAPEGFELIPSAEDDCDDSDESVFRLAQYFRDEDGDGFSDGDESIFFCRDGSTPEGFLSQASATIDCDDSDANVFEQADTFVDADGDGATLGNAIPECIGDTPPQGRRLTRSPVSDCDDSAADIFPSAPDVCNGVDDNCDGRTDFGVGSDCGVGCSPVYPDVDETLSLAENIDAGNMLSVFNLVRLL